MRKLAMGLAAALAMMAAGVASAQSTASAPDKKAPASAPDKKAPASAPDKEPTTPADYLPVLKAVAPSLVRVEYWLQYDKGEPPVFMTGGMRAGSGVFGWEQPEQAVRQERPAEMGGVLVGPTRVVLPDPVVHPRFVKDIQVRFGSDVVKAKVAAHAKAHSAIFLDLERPLKGAKPLEFKPQAKGPYLALVYDRLDGIWSTVISEVSAANLMSMEGRDNLCRSSSGLYVDKKGQAVALVFDDEITLDESWKGSPAQWPAISGDEMQKLLADLEKRTNAGLRRVKLSFRSPKKGDSPVARFGRGGEEGEVTEMHVPGVVTGPRQVLVLAYLKPNLTARLERIELFPLAGGEAVTGKFAGSLTNYGAMIVEVDKPLDAPVAFSKQGLLQCRRQLLPTTDIRVQGETVRTFYGYRRILGYDLGHKQQLHPQIAGRDQEMIVFDAAGGLLALPLAWREKVTVSEGYGGMGPALTACQYVTETLGDLAKQTDPSNVPLTEEQENRIAWMGVELQPLNRDLARIHKVGELTNDGQTGAIVSYVYPGSPADKAGVKPEFVLIRLHVADHPKPLEVRVEDAGFVMPWDRLDQVPEQYYDRIPSPWPAAENVFTRALTDLGFGKAYTAEFFSGGKVVKLDFTVVQSPPNYDSAPKYKNESLGLTVRDLSYEVRRYFQKTDEEPGVIASKIEPGGKASVAGVKPYEIITHVNEKAVMNVKDFERLTANQDELRLNVKRMTRGRVVKIKMTGPDATTRPATRPAPPPAGGDLGE